MRVAERAQAAALAAAAALAVAAVVTAPAAGAPRHAADGTLADWRGKPTNLGGRTQISRGELIHTDYLYDDYGPDLDGRSNPPALPSTNTARTSGDYRYPADDGRLANNGADLRELRLALDRRGLHAAIALQTMIDPNAATATIAIDADGKAATGAGEWPRGAGLTTPGADLFITVSGAGAELTRADGSSRSLPHSAHRRANTFEVDVPPRHLGKLSGGARVWAGVGLTGPGGGYASQRPNATALFDLAFQGAETYERGSSWSDQRQSAALAGAAAPFSQPLKPKALRDGKSRRFRLVPGFYNRIFRSEHAYGEGVALRDGGIVGSASPEFLGRHQPYGLYVPSGYDPKRPAQLLLDLHSLDRGHNQYASVMPNRLAQLGDQRDSVIVTPLARSVEGWYLDAGLIDVLEAWRDARRTVSIDPRRTSISGYSMGGYGTFRLGLLMPDRFARAAAHVPPQIYGYWAYPAPPIGTAPEWRVASNTKLIVANGLNLPFELNAGDLDTLVPISGVADQAERFAQAGNPYRFYRHGGDDHFSFAIADEWGHTRDWLGRHKVVRNPVRVRYRRYPAMDLERAGLVFDGAYWVDDMVVRDDDDAADASGAVDATTLALGRRPPVALPQEPIRVEPGGGGRSAATVTGQQLRPGKPGKRRNAFTLTVENLAAVTLAAPRMGLDPDRTVRARVRGDGRTRLRLGGSWPRRLEARLDGERIAVRGGERGARLSVALQPNATHELIIRPGGRR